MDPVRQVRRFSRPKLPSTIASITTATSTRKPYRGLRSMPASYARSPVTRSPRRATADITTPHVDKKKNRREAVDSPGKGSWLAPRVWHFPVGVATPPGLNVTGGGIDRPNDQQSDQSIDHLVHGPGKEPKVPPSNSHNSRPGDGNQRLSTRWCESPARDTVAMERFLSPDVLRPPSRSTASNQDTLNPSLSRRPPPHLLNSSQGNEKLRMPYLWISKLPSTLKRCTRNGRGELLEDKTSGIALQSVMNRLCASIYANYKKLG